MSQVKISFSESLSFSFKGGISWGTTSWERVVKYIYFRWARFLAIHLCLLSLDIVVYFLSIESMNDPWLTIWFVVDPKFMSLNHVNIDHLSFKL